MDDFNRFKKGLFKTVRYVHKKTGYLSFVIFLDVLWCYVRYGASFKEYRLFEFYKLDSTSRNSYMTKRKYKKVNKKLVDQAIINVITDKKLFVLRFKEYVNKNLVNLNEHSYKEFEDKIYPYKDLVSRSINSSFIKSYKEFNTSKYRSAAYLNKELKDKKLTLVERKINIHEDLKELDDIVVINVVSVFINKCNIITSSIKFKKDNKIISGYIDINKGIIIGNLKDSEGHNYKDLNGFNIPCFDKIVKMCKQVSYELEEIKQIEWSFTVDNKDKVYLVDANVFTDYIFAQTPEFLKNKTGLMKYYDKII